MHSTSELLAKAKEKMPLAEWNRELKLNSNALFNARSRGRLSPIIAGAIAEKLGENVQHWMAVAVLEGEKESGAKDHLVKTAKNWLNLKKP